MNFFLATLRHIALGGIIASIVTLLPGFLIIWIPLYLIFMFFSYLSAKNTADKLSEELGVDIPHNNYFKTLIRGIGIDLLSPISAITGLFKDGSYKVANFIITYLIIIFNVAVIVFVWLIELGVLAVFSDMLK